jgi:protocatechuate 3,4-dioxygenase, alpha subunit
MARVTPSQTVGPFFGFALPYEGDHDLVAPDAAGAIRIEGQVLDGDGAPVPDALLETWQAGPDGSYDGPGALFGRCRTDPEGGFHFLTVRPGRVPLDGRPQAPHLWLTVHARGLLRQLVTRIYLPDEAEANAADPVLSSVDDARRPTLIAEGDGDVLRFDVRLQGERETVFFAL